MMAAIWDDVGVLTLITATGSHHCCSSNNGDQSSNMRAQSDLNESVMLTFLIPRERGFQASVQSAVIRDHAGTPAAAAKHE